MPDSGKEVKGVKVPSLLEAYWRNANKLNLEQWGHDLIQLEIFTAGAMCIGFLQISKLS